MKKLNAQSLSDETEKALAGYQAEIDGLKTFPERAKKANAIWGSRKQNKPFEEVKEKLILMCAGARRCCYCEDSYADEIEHIWPKSIFPGKTFVWENYLYSCGPCNGPKGNKFGIFSPDRKRRDLNKEDRVDPVKVEALLVNPREENPLEYLFLDIVDSFAFDPMEDDTGSESYIRADYTIEILKLNERDALIQARKNAYSNFRARLKEYISEKQNGSPQEELDKLIMGIQEEAHPTVWEEMKRQRENIPELTLLFNDASEALNW